MKSLLSQVVIGLCVVTLSNAFFFDNIYYKLIERSIKEQISDKLANREIDIEFTFPKTKWCGPGNTAQGFEDLGEDRETDICCRDHDQCQLWIGPGEEMCGVKNTEIFLISSCDCDQRFRQCLESVFNRDVFTSAPVVARIYSTLIKKCIFIDPTTNSCSLIDRNF